MHKVGFLLEEGFQVMALSTQAVFESANLTFGEKFYQVENYSMQGGDIRSSLGMVVQTRAVDEHSTADTWIVGGVNDPMAAPASQAKKRFLQNAAFHAKRIPANLRDPDGQWFALTTRARIVYASKKRVAEAEVTTYEDLTLDKWRGRICTRLGTHAYTLGLIAAYIHHHGEEATQTWLEGVKANLAHKPQGNDRAQIKAMGAERSPPVILSNS